MLSGVEYIICETQGRIYEYIARNNIDLVDFSNQYLSSNFCKRSMDTSYSRFQWADEEECLDFIFPQIKIKKSESWFSPAEAFWIGFTYRQLYIETGIPSKQLCEEIPFWRMRNMYPGMHTIEENQVAEIICESHHWKKREN